MRRGLQEWLAERPTSVEEFTPRRITFILGAGVSLALASKENKASASWQGLLTALLGGTNKRLKDYLHQGEREDQWLKQTSVQHRMHIIQTLSQGNPDMAVAMMYLINRIHKQHICTGVNQSLYSWQEDLNDAMYKIEQGKPDKEWKKVLKKMGQLARKGNALLITTNFDHLVAGLTGLPVYLGPRKTAPPAASQESAYCAWPHGCAIPAAKVQEEKVLSPAEFAEDILGRTLPAPAAFHQAWKRPSSIPQSWFAQLASVLHIHGSRRLPPSLVFDPSSYDSIAEAGDGNNLLGSLIREPNHSGAVIFVGCGGTLLDPHFIKYWKTRGADSFVACLASDEAADDLCRQLHIFNFDRPPQIVSYGADHQQLPIELMKILALL